MTPISATSPVSPLLERPCPFITFYSFKGGVGRSMAVINVAGIIAARGFRVLVIDMDLEAPGISYLATEVTGSEERPQPGIVDFLSDAVERGRESALFGESAAMAVARYCGRYELPEGAPNGSLHIMPAGRLDGDYPARLERLGLPDLYRVGDGLALIRAFKQAVQESGLFDYVFIDSRTGFSDESGICTRDLADYLMIVSGLNKQNVEGTAQFLAALRKATGGERRFEVILSPVPNGEDTLVDQREAAARVAFEAAWGAPIQLQLQIPYHPQLALTEDPHIFRRRRGYLFEAYHRIERHVLRMIGDTPDTFSDAADAAMKEKDFARTLVLLHRAQSLSDNTDWLTRFALSLTSMEPIPMSPEALPVCDFVIDRANPRLRRYLAEILGNQAIDMMTVHKDVVAAGALYTRALAAGPSHANNLGNYASFLLNTHKNIDTAEALFARALEADPSHANNLGKYASFLETVRRDMDSAEALYRRAIDAAPFDANNLGNYADFLHTVRKDMDAAEALYRRAIETDPFHANNLGNFAHFLGLVRKDMEASETLYSRALDAAPFDANNLGNYADFLHTVRKDMDAAEALYRRAIETDPSHANNLGNYANFLRLVRKDMEAAETLYSRALEADPSHANNLGNFATFLQTVHNDMEAAEVLYKRALDADPTHVNNLGNYARFLYFERKDMDAAEALYKRALEAEPSHARNLWNYADFLQTVRKDMDAAEALCKRALEAEPSHANHLGSYANFVQTVRKDMDAAEALYKRAVEADPSHANNLGNYAIFLQTVRKDVDTAGALYKRALEAEPSHANHLGSYALLRLTSGHLAEGLALIDRALASIGPDTPRVVELECQMYRYCCGTPEQREAALARAKHLVTVELLDTGDWDFSGVILQAEKMNHPETRWLRALAEVLSGRAPVTSLDEWDAWRAA